MDNEKKWKILKFIDLSTIIGVVVGILGAAATAYGVRPLYKCNIFSLYPPIRI